MTFNELEFWNSFDAIANIGKTQSGGCQRLSMSDEDIEARNALIKMLEADGLNPWVDNSGGIWAVIKGSDPTLPSVLTGSHIDTVRNAGRYDGTLGSMLSYQAMKAIKQQGVPHKRNIELIVFPTEESARFNFPTAGSKLLGGKITAEKFKEYKDANGISLYDALVARGYQPDNISDVQEKIKNSHSMLEVHIEQGPFLESEGLSIGVVTAIAAPTRLRVTIKGRYDHSGACPMHLRKDALAAAAELVLQVEKIGNNEAKNSSVAAVTLLDLENPSMNVVPGSVVLAIDIRGTQEESIALCVKQVEQALEDISAKRGVTFSLSVISSDQPVLMSEQVMSVIEESCKTLEIPTMRLASGAGHDTMNIAHLVNAGMIFIPCKNGVSHNPAEEVSKKDVELAFKVLANSLVTLANS